MLTAKRPTGRPVVRFRSWARLGTTAVGLIALFWLLLRTGTRPSRLSYPCQQAALGTASAAIGAPIVAAVVGCHVRWMTGMRARVTGRAVYVSRPVYGVVFLGALLLLSIGLAGLASYDSLNSVNILTPPPGYRADVYLVSQARGIEPGRFGGVDDLVTLMGSRGFKWYRSATVSLTTGPDGLIDRDDVVLIKINAQWPERGGTNTDVLRGVIRRIVEHPDGFTGEIIVADNGQGRGNLDRADNNAEDHSQSAADVVNDFAREEWAVSGRRWDSIAWTSVEEYADGDMRSGYVVSPTWDPDTAIKVSYPKFQSSFGTYISYKRGIWFPHSGSYDAEKLVVINLPVFKTHIIYGITAAVKNHMGVITTRVHTDSHLGVARGGLGSVLAEVRMPDLTILDCIWILARPTGGPPAAYQDATRRDQLVAGTDPVALDAWAAKFIMIPQIIENDYSYGDYEDRQDPDNPGSRFRGYLDPTMNEMLLGGIETTNDYSAVELHVWTGDRDRDGDVDLNDISTIGTCLTGPAGAIDPACAAFDADTDGAMDLKDVAELQKTFTGSL